MNKLSGDETNSNKIITYNILSTVILYAITFFSSPIFSRMLGTSQYGVVQVYNTWHAFFAIIVGLMTRGVLPMARVKFTEKEQEAFQSSMLGLSLAAFLCVSLLTLTFHRYIVPFFGLDLKFLIVLLLHSFGTFCVLFINAKFTYEMKARNNLCISVSLSLATFLLSFLMVWLSDVESRYAGRILGTAVPYVIAGIGVIVYIFRRGKLFYSKVYWKFSLPLCLPLIFHSVSSIICSSGDRIMIQKMLSISAVGIYTLAYNFANIMDSIWVALNNSWTPFMVEYIKAKQFDILKEKSANYTRIYTCLCIGFVLLTPEVFRMFAAESYWRGAVIIPIVVISQFAIFVYAFASNYEFCFMRTDFVAIGSVIAGVSNIVLNFVFIPFWGYLGAAITTMISNVILLACHVNFAKKLTQKNWVYSIRMFVPAVLGIAVATTVYYMCYDLWPVRWMMAIAVGIYMIMDIYKRKSIF